MMATTLPRPSLSPYDPPTAALPPLPISKTRKSLPTPSMSTALAARSPSAALTPSKIRSPSKGTIPVPKIQQHATSTPAVPTLKTAAGKAAAAAGDKSVRKSVSIAAFPQPPKARSRIGRPSLPSSINTNSGSESQRRSPTSSTTSTTPTTPAEASRPKKLKKTSSSAGLHSQYLSGSGPSLLNGSGGSVPITPENRHRDSDGLLSLPSPPMSRSSSAQESHSTQGTNFEDMEEVPSRGRNDSNRSSDSSNRRSTLKEGKGNVIVSVRVRPNGGTESVTDGEWMVDGRRSLIAYKGKEGGDYFYDNVFSPHDGNSKLYEVSAKRLVRRVMEGYHGTVFAYGMTGTGKTFSMQGTASQPGIIPQAVADVFSYIRETPHREFLLRASYLEIYNEEIRDLLSPPPPPGTQPEKIKLREDSKRGVYATPVKEEIVQSPMQLLRVISRGDRSRHTGTTQYNLHSSRSHAVVKIVVESRERAAVDGVEDKHAAIAPGGVRVSSLSMIDLAGSERAADSKERRTEGAHINKSLLTLGTVIARLSGEKDKNGNAADKDGKHLPYRDSKLTRLLQPALAGSSLISILCTIQIGSSGSAATASSHTMETLNTLKFAARAKNNIVSHAKKAEEALANGTDPGSIALLDRYRKEISALRGQLDSQVQVQVKAEEMLAQLQEKELVKETEDRHNDQMVEMQLARTALKERIEHLNRLILCSQSQGVNANSTTSLGMSPLLAAAYSSLTPARSVRSSASTSTLQRSASGASQNTISNHLASLRSPTTSIDPGACEANVDNDEEEDGEGIASLQAQNKALQSDLADKTRYISTLERRLLQARRSSHSRASTGISLATLQEKDAEIADLQYQLEERNRTVMALRSVASISATSAAESTATTPASPSVRNHHASDSYGSSSAATSNSTFSPVDLTAKNKSPFDIVTSPKSLSDAAQAGQNTDNIPSASHMVGVRTSADRLEGDRNSTQQQQQQQQQQRRSIEEMSRMLDEMIQEKVERGELVSDRHGSLGSAFGDHRISGGSIKAVRPRRQESWQAEGVPSVAALAKGLRTESTFINGATLGLGVEGV